MTFSCDCADCACTIAGRAQIDASRAHSNIECRSVAPTHSIRNLLQNVISVEPTTISENRQFVEILAMTMHSMCNLLQGRMRLAAIHGLLRGFVEIPA